MIKRGWIRRSSPLPPADPELALAPDAPPVNGARVFFDELTKLEELKVQTGLGSAFGLILMSLIRQGWNKAEIIAMMTTSVENKFEEAKQIVEHLEPKRL